MSLETKGTAATVDAAVAFVKRKSLPVVQKPTADVPATEGLVLRVLYDNVLGHVMTFLTPAGRAQWASTGRRTWTRHSANAVCLIVDNTLSMLAGQQTLSCLRMHSQSECERD